jgi:hypothetical protein
MIASDGVEVFISVYFFFFGWYEETGDRVIHFQ